ncbi:sialidase family protein [Synoicihabitans lomoniglobus]|uniref:Sialidase family protein n=1 Tax=Synoicihabitans lomoniglobus TaxID=2909285 RepID=A0AAF0CRY4_9BACT|nr:glycoside hydrolase [Opitutaceae bacterium LMO-M01]WED66992.1 sialidase family protein [Opitutaceae bacterium LMO-M01]
MILRRLLLLSLLALPFSAHAQSETPFPEDLLRRAVEAKPPRWKFVRGTRYRELPETFAMQLVAIAAHRAPYHRVGDTTLAASLATKLQYFLRSPGPDADGNTREPEAQGGIGGWSHNAAAQALLIAKRTRQVWELLTPDDCHRADVLMHALAVGGHFTHGDANDYHVLLDGISWYHKSWNPNHIEGYAGVMIAAADYFGADELNDFFVNFDYATFRAELVEVGFHNILQTWENEPAMAGLLMNGGPYQREGRPPGNGSGIRQPFTYRGLTLHEPWAIYLTQADRLFSKAARTQVAFSNEESSRLLHHRSDATISPYEGRMGMIYEFEAGDNGGMRTSLGYAYDCVMIHLGTAATLKVLRQWPDDASGRDIERRMAVGMADLIFKAEEGYSGWANGKVSANDMDDLKANGADYIFGLWRALFPPPEPLAENAGGGATILGHDVLYADPDVYAAWPALVRASNGDLLVTFCATEEHLAPDGKIVLIRSTDHGATWSAPITIYDSPLDDRENGLTVAPDGTLALHVWSTAWTAQAYADLKPGSYPSDTLARWTNQVNTPAYQAASADQGNWVLTSTDHGHTWTKRVRGPDSVHGGIVLSDGTWLTAAYRQDQGDISIHTAATSTGPWRHTATIATPQSDTLRFGEPHVAQQPDGRITVVIRGTAIPYDDQRNDLFWWTSHSDDGGTTWSAPQSSGRWGFPPHVTTLRDGRLLATYGYRRFPYGERAAISADGVDWQATPEFVLRSDAPDHDLGYPVSLETSRGKILTVYYQKPASNRRPAIMATHWNLP